MTHDFNRLWQGWKHEQLQHATDQKDATIAEKEQQLRQSRGEGIWQQNQRIQQLERDK